MPRIVIPTSAQVGANEMPYFMLQALPDRIRYTTQGTPHAILEGALLGAQGFNNKIQIYIDVLGRNGWLATPGGTPFSPLTKAWLKYLGTAGKSTNLAADTAVINDLAAFQREASVGSNFTQLPVKAKSAAFWDTAPEVVLPRISQQEHLAMG